MYAWKDEHTSPEKMEQFIAEPEKIETFILNYVFSSIQVVYEVVEDNFEQKLDRNFAPCF